MAAIITGIEAAKLRCLVLRLRLMLPIPALATR